MNKLLLFLLLACSSALAANTPPKIYGSPSPTSYVGEKYYFKPTVTDPDGPTRKFVIKNRPSWASFSYQSGSIAGTPTKTGWNTGIVIYVQDGANKSVPLKTFSIQTLDNKAPVISGTPVGQTTAGQAYSFQPTASDPDSDPLTYAIENKPSWANFEAATGRLYGTPPNSYVGTYSNIRISVTDGRAIVSLPIFSIAVTAMQLGTAMLTWTPPTKNTDDSALTNLAGYRVLYGPSPSLLATIIDVRNPSVSAYTVENLTAGTWYFCIKAFNTAGQESVCSNVASKTI